MATWARRYPLSVSACTAVYLRFSVTVLPLLARIFTVIVNDFFGRPFSVNDFPTFLPVRVASVFLP